MCVGTESLGLTAIEEEQLSINNFKVIQAEVSIAMRQKTTRIRQHLGGFHVCGMPSIETFNFT